MKSLGELIESVIGNAKPNIDEKTQLECQRIRAEEEKIRLESEKIKTETGLIRRPLLQRFEFWGSISPAIVAVSTLILTVGWAWRAGWFDVQRTRAEVEKTRNENERVLVQIQTERLQKMAAEQEARVIATEENLQNLKSDRALLTNSIAQLHAEREQLRSGIESLEKEVLRLAGSDTNASKLLLELTSEKTQTAILRAQLTTATNHNLMLAEALSRQQRLGLLYNLRAQTLRQLRPSKRDYEDFLDLIIAKQSEITRVSIDDFDFSGPHWQIRSNLTDSPTAK